MAKTSTTTLALPRIELEEKVLDVRLRLKGKAAVDLADYQRAYAATTGDKVEPEALVLHMVTAFIEADRGFQAWRKADTGADARRGG